MTVKKVYIEMYYCIYILKFNKQTNIIVKNKATNLNK